MKKYVFLILVCIFFQHSYAQVEITPQYGYQVGAKYNFYNGYVKMDASDQYGLTLNFDLNGYGLQAEAFWVMQNSVVSIRDYYDYPRETEISDLKVNHFQFGVINQWENGQLAPFFGMSAGFSIFDPSEYNSSTKFTLGLSGGLKYYFTDVIGIRLQSQLLMPIDWGGVYIYPGGSSVDVGGTILQLNFSGGLIFALGR